MSNQILTITRTTDRALVRHFRELAQAYPGAHLSFRILSGGDSLDDARDRPALDRIAEQNSSIIFNVQLNFPGLSIEYQRGGANKSGIFDEIKFTPHNNGDGKRLTAEQRIAFISTLVANFAPVDPARAIAGAATEAHAELQALHSSILQRLEETATSQLQRNSEYFQKLEVDHVERRKQLETAFQSRQLDLDKRFADQRTELDKQTKRLADRERELDDRTHTHARRAIRGDLKSELAKREQEFRLTKGTRRMRAPVHLLCTLLLLGVGGLLVYTSWDTLNLIKAWSSESSTLLRPEFYYVFVRQFVLAAAFAGITIGYGRWLMHWHEEHAEAEFELKRFQLDVDRASWVVETAFEWQSQVKAAMPSQLLAAITTNLFQHRSTHEEARAHPADELASALLGTASKVKLQAGPAELELDGKRLRKAKRIVREPSPEVVANGHHPAT